MSVITTRHLDDSELTDEELAHWGPRLKESLASDYAERIKAMLATRQFARTPGGRAALEEQAWEETIADNEVCKTISAMSARRRVEKMLASGVYVPAPGQRQATAADVEAMLRDAHPQGELELFDGTPLEEGEIEQITELANDPERLAQALKEYEGTFQGSWAWGEILSSVRTKWARFLAPRDAADARPTTSLLQASQLPIEHRSPGNRPA